MLLRSIKLEGWRRFANPVSVENLSDGLNVIHGPNGCGKSTLMLALVRALFDSHDSSGKEVESLRPWGRELAPKVALEFEHDGVRYQLTKRYLQDKEAMLQRSEENRFTNFRSGRNADEFVRGLLRGEKASRGFTKYQHWGLAQMLWVPQGDMELAELTGTAREVLQQSLGIQIASPQASQVEKRIEREFNAIYTPSGKFKSGRDEATVTRVEANVQQAVQLVNELRAKQQAYEDAARQIESLQNAADTAKRTEQERLALMQQTRERAEQYQAVENRVGLLTHQADGIQAKLIELRRRVDEIRQARQEIERDEQALRELRHVSDLLAREVDQARLAAEKARAQSDIVRQRRVVLDQARARAERAKTYRAARNALSDLEQRLAAVTTLAAQIEELRARQRTILAPTPKQLTELRKLADRARELRIRCEASLISLRIEPETTINGEVLAGSEAGRAWTNQAEPIVARGASEVVLRIAGLGVIRASGPTTSSAELEAELHDAEQQWQTSQIKWGGLSLDELERHQLAAQDVTHEIKRLEGQISVHLKSQTPDDLRSEQAVQERTLATLLAEEPSWSTEPPMPAAYQSHAETLELEFRRDIDQAEHEAKLASEAHANSSQRLVKHDAEIIAAQQRIQNTRARLERLQADGRDDATRHQHYEELLSQSEIADRQLREAKAELARFTGNPREELLRLEKEVVALRATAERSLQDLTKQRTRLDQLLSDAPYSKLSAAEEELATLRESLAREQLAAEATRLLHETISAVKREMNVSVMEPVARYARQTLQRIMGSRFTDLQFNDSLQLESIMPGTASDTTVSLDQLSGGEREQIHFCVRLALAHVAFAQQRELVVFDDVFVYTDAARIARIATILAETAERFQVILLTCHPERYRGLPNANFIDLELLVNL